MRVSSVFCVVCVAILLAACNNNDIKENLGLTHRAPDEFRVVERPPLSVPPEFNLNPPSKGADIPSGVASDARAHDQILGQKSDLHGASLAPTTVIPVGSGPLPSSADAQFLADIGSSHADPNIRDVITQERQAGYVPKDANYAISSKPDGEPTVDAAKEAQRLKDDKDQGKPATTGETPVITPKDTGILGNIF